MPLRAILQHDLWGLYQSRLVRVWLAVTALLTAMVILTNWVQVPSAPLIAMVLFPYLVFPWFLVVMMLGVNPTSGSRADAMADGFLCRPVTRYECLLGTWLARLLLVWGVYLIVTVPAVAIVVYAKRPVADDGVTLYGIIAALSVVGLVLALQVSLGFLMGTLLRRSLLAVVVLLLAWYPINLVLHTFSLEEFSPISLNQALPTLLRQPWSEDPEAETSKAGDMEALAQQAAQFLSILSGGPSQPAARPGFFERASYEDFSLVRVLLGYGIPTLLSIALATVCFNVRDF
jgi:ABC-type transport system involved in multi-copper enzyme maturation permease subunit